MAGHGVDEVHGAVVRAEDDPGAAVALEHRGLARSSPLPHQFVVSPLSSDSEHIGFPGYFHTTCGAAGTGPWP